jgi:acetyl-CoA carboxylase biotin carboxyl carrier protein
MERILAHVAGTVVKIETSVGAQVAKGDVVVMLESMKMLIPVEAESTGEVAQIRCAEGAMVDEGEVLVLLK